MLCTTLCATCLDDFVIDLGVENAGDEASPDTLDLVWSRCSSRQDGTLCRLNSHNGNGWILLLQVPARSGNSATSSDSSDEEIDLHWSSPVSKT